MAIPKLTDDLNIIATLGDNPNTDNNLTPEELKKKFDVAALIIQTLFPWSTRTRKMLATSCQQPAAPCRVA